MSYRRLDGWLDVLFGLAFWALHFALLACKHRILACTGGGSADKYVERVDVGAAHDQRISKRLVIAGQPELSQVLVKILKLVRPTDTHKVIVFNSGDGDTGRINGSDIMLLCVSLTSKSSSARVWAYQISSNVRNQSTVRSHSRRAIDKLTCEPKH